MEARRRKRLLQRSLLSGAPEEGTKEHESWTSNQKASPLLRLPPEIRNRIYELVLSVGIISVHHRPVTHAWRVADDAHGGTTSKTTVRGGFYCRRFDASQNPRGATDGAGRGGMTLLAPVCRQLYRETALLPFQLNAWCFASVPVMERYVLTERRLPREQRRAVRTLYLNGGSTKDVHKCFGELEVLVWYSKWTGNKRRTSLPARHEDKARALARSKQLGQTIELFDT